MGEFNPLLGLCCVGWLYCNMWGRWTDEEVRSLSIVGVDCMMVDDKNGSSIVDEE